MPMSSPIKSVLQVLSLRISYLRDWFLFSLFLITQTLPRLLGVSPIHDYYFNPCFSPFFLPLDEGSGERQKGGVVAIYLGMNFY